ncbi:MAG TPA: hypothetical protein VN788_15415 [Verrucomicrobiae bacterium]|nr:hypothetical protein [Verrucomicrobiae bacterium]
MQRVSTALLAAVLFLAVPVMARAGGDKGAVPADKATDPSTSKSPDKAATAQPNKTARPSPKTDLQQLQDSVQQQQEELAAQRKALDEQQKEIEALKGASVSQPAIATNAQSPAEPSGAASRAPAISPMPLALSAKPSSIAPALRRTESNSMSHASTRLAAPPPQDNGQKLSPIALQDFKIGATFYGSFSHFTNTGLVPAFQDTPTVQLGPGNSGLNAFEVNRAYINLFYTPNAHVTLRITPDIYREIDSTDGAIAAGNGAQTNGTDNGNYSFRLKYAYVDFQKIFGDGALKDDRVTFGQTQNPLIDWEEGLSGYRYAYLVPWNYLSLSSTYSGAKLHGPIKVNGKEYLDYDIGVFNTASFHAIETNDKKQAMGRLTWYPLGTTVDLTGFGLTFFENYGYNTKLQSQVSTPLNRLAVLGHFQSHNKQYEIVGEYDLGRNALSTGNLFSGAAPVSGGPFFLGGGSSDIGTVSAAVLAGNATRQQGFAFFGHAGLGHSPFSVWGFYQYFQPNTKFPGTDPIDLSRTVGGISYHVEKHFDVAFGDENFHWIHPQGMLGAGDTNGIVIWTQFTY